ncbi:MAG: glycosyltransferase family 2 protein [Planctomycetes bacterium]|nr:glycosyltransferase family 2 protein [Planctomycetota bacterium]
MAALSVSVIIPVYNAEKYLRQAVESVLAERADGVKEIILVEDCSPDNALAVAEKLVSEHSDIIHVYRHPDGKNHGAGASRNLGIKNATGDLICFLDADDYWLPGKLARPVEILSADMSADGIYDISGMLYLDKEEEEISEFRGVEVSRLKPEEIFSALLLKSVSHWQTNNFTVRKSAFDKVGLYNEDLPLAQDTELALRMAALLRMVPSGSTEPATVTRRHGDNRYDPQKVSASPESRWAHMRQVFESLDRWFSAWSVPEDKRVMFRRFYIRRLSARREFRTAMRKASKYGMLWWGICCFARFIIPGPRTLLNMMRG